MKKRVVAGILSIVIFVILFGKTEFVHTYAEALSEAEYIKERLDNLTELLQGKYFTVSRKACSKSRKSGHGCDNCSIYYIAKTDWFKDMFGYVDTADFPEHDVNSKRRANSGRSCFGFACFAQWYVFNTENNQKLSAERIVSGKYNREFAEANILPGDVLRLSSSHSVIVYSVESDGIVVLDCNWNMGGQLNCIVQKHKISYKNSSYGGKTVYVNRVTNFNFEDVHKLSADGSTNTKSQYVYYHYTDGTCGEYSVCAYSGSYFYGWSREDVYREEICVDEPLRLVSSSPTSYRHINWGSTCTEAGCSDESWIGGAFADDNGVIWYREQLRTVEVENTDIENGFGEWTRDSSLINNPDYEFETKLVKEYSYTERETTTSHESNLSGWNCYGSYNDWYETVAPTKEKLTAGEGERIETIISADKKDKTVYRYCNYFWVDSDGDWRATSARLLPKEYRENETVENYSGRFVGTYTGSGKARRSTGFYNVWYSAEYDEPLTYINGKGWVDDNGTNWWQDASYTKKSAEDVVYYRMLKEMTIYQYERYNTVEGLSERPDDAEGRVISENTVTYYRYRLKNN